MIRWIATRMRWWADRIDPKGAPRRTSFSMTLEGRDGWKFWDDGRGCPLWYYGDEDYERGFTEARENEKVDDETRMRYDG